MEGTGAELQPEGYVRLDFSPDFQRIRISGRRYRAQKRSVLKDVTLRPDDALTSIWKSWPAVAAYATLCVFFNASFERFVF
jgi:hypothetical protein